MDYQEYINSLPIKVGDLTNKGIITNVERGFLSELDAYYTEGKTYPDYYTKDQLILLQEN